MKTSYKYIHLILSSHFKTKIICVVFNCYLIEKQDRKRRFYLYFNVYFYGYDYDNYFFANISN